MGKSNTADLVIAGGGIIGLSLGLELRLRGLTVIVLERHRAMRGASWAAGGMLAARDPENPPAMLPISLLSLALYPAFLEKVQALSGRSVPVRTRTTLQAVSPVHAISHPIAEASLQEIQQWIPGFAPRDLEEKFLWLEEDSIDPRDLCQALPAAFRQAEGILLEEMAVLNVEPEGSGIVVQTAQEKIHASAFINCCGAWAGETQLGSLPVAPVKGQAATIALKPNRLRCVLRTPEFYAIPRGDGRITIGATVEHVGFDEVVEPPRIHELLEQGIAQLLPEIQAAKMLESWAGLRPGTPDELPILGAAAMEHCWHATGHYRNGILLAPATARVMTQLILGEAPDIPLENFSQSRFPIPASASECGLQSRVHSGVVPR